MDRRFLPDDYTTYQSGEGIFSSIANLISKTNPTTIAKAVSNVASNKDIQKIALTAGEAGAKSLGSKAGDYVGDRFFKKDITNTNVIPDSNKKKILDKIYGKPSNKPSIPRDLYNGEGLRKRKIKILT